jgi:hypothetical protein
MKTKWNLPLLLALALPVAAFAHTNEYLDTIDGAHGGQLRMSGPYHFELVATPGELTVYLTDHGDNPVDSAGGTALALIRNGDTKVEIALEPSGSNLFRGQGEFELDESTTVHLKISVPGAAPEMASFRPMRKRPKPSGNEGHHDHH